MCKFPIHIGNRSRTFVDATHPVEFVVPCGHCSDCVRSYQDDWFFRSFFEYKDCISKGGTVYFILLTYDNDHLPYYHDATYDGWKKFGYQIPCFDPTHLKRFRDKLRVNLSRKLGPEKSLGVRFFFASEFGYNTGRPHYHAMIFVPFEHDKSLFLGTSKGKYTDGLFAKCWSYGFIGKGKKHNPWIESPNGVSYCMKYLDKDSKWIRKYKIPEYKSYLHDRQDMNDDAVKARYNAFRRVCPRHYQSMSFGLSALSNFVKDGVPCYDMFLQNYDLSKHGFIAKYTYKIPRYYYNKLFYDVDAVNEVRYLNKHGLQMKRKEFDFMLKSRVDYYKKFHDFVSFRSLASHVPEYNLRHYLAGFNCTSLDEFYDLIFPVTPDTGSFDLERLSLYSVVYRSLNMHDYAFLSDFTSDEQYKFLRDNAYDIYCSRFDYNPYLVYPKGEQPFCTDPNFKSCVDFSYFDIFRGFDSTLYLIEHYNYFVNHFIEDYSRSKNDMLLKLENKVNPHKFVSLSNLIL